MVDRHLLRASLAVVGLLLFAIVADGCGSAKQATRIPKGISSYVGHASNAEVFIEWSRTGNGVSGSLQEAIQKQGGGELESNSTAFKGTISTNGVALTLNQGLGSTKALVGRLRGSGFVMTFPGTQHGLITIAFVPGGVAGYNAAVRELEAATQATTTASGPEATTGEPSTPATHGSLVGNDCESVPGPGGGEYAITAVAGFSCAIARHVFTELFAGNGQFYEGPDSATTYTMVEDWKCGGDMGAFACAPPGSGEIRIEADSEGAGG